MAKYKVLAESWIGDRLVPAGSIIEYAGEPGVQLELVKQPKKGKADVEAEADAPAADADPVI